MKEIGKKGLSYELRIPPPAKTWDFEQEQIYHDESATRICFKDILAFASFDKSDMMAFSHAGQPSPVQPRSSQECYNNVKVLVVYDVKTEWY